MPVRGRETVAGVTCAAWTVLASDRHAGVRPALRKIETPMRQSATWPTHCVYGGRCIPPPWMLCRLHPGPIIRSWRASTHAWTPLGHCGPRRNTC